MSKSHSVARWNLGMEIYNVVDQQRLNMYGILHQEIIKLCVPTSSNTHQRLYVLASSHHHTTMSLLGSVLKATRRPKVSWVCLSTSRGRYPRRAGSAWTPRRHLGNAFKTLLALVLPTIFSCYCMQECAYVNLILSNK